MNYNKIVSLILENYSNIKAVIVSGIHGDEPAGNVAAKHFKNLKDVYVVDKFNKTNKRKENNKDLNRHFGKGDVSKDEELLQTIEKLNPKIVISLHEDDHTDATFMYSSEDLAEFLEKILKDLKIDVVHNKKIHNDKIVKGVVIGGLSHRRPGTLESQMKKRGIPHCVIETPTKTLPLKERANIHKKIVTSILKRI